METRLLSFSKVIQALLVTAAKQMVHLSRHTVLSAQGIGEQPSAEITRPSSPYLPSLHTTETSKRQLRPQLPAHHHIRPCPT